MSAFTQTPSDKLNSVGKSPSASSNGLSTCLYIAEAAHVATIPARTADTNSISSDITFDVGKFFQTFHIAEDGSILSWTSQGTTGSANFQTKLTVFLPGQHDQLEEFLNEAINDEFIVLAEDSKGNLRVIGDAYRPATIPSDGVDFQQAAEKEGTLLIFLYNGKIPAIYTGAITTS